MKKKINNLDVSGGVSFKDIANVITTTVGCMFLVGIGIGLEKKCGAYNKTKDKLNEWVNN